MLRSKLLSLTLFALGGLAIPTAHAEKPLKEQIVGTWIYVSSTGKNADGSSFERPPLQGAVTYTADGHFHFIATRPDLPKYASGDARKPTPEEAMAVASGAVAYTGTYTVDEANKTINATVKAATFRHLMEEPQRRVISAISDTEMTFINPRTPSGQSLEIRWKRDPAVESSK